MRLSGRVSPITGIYNYSELRDELAATATLCHHATTEALA